MFERGVDLALQLRQRVGRRVAHRGAIARMMRNPPRAGRQAIGDAAAFAPSLAGCRAIVGLLLAHFMRGREAGHDSLSPARDAP